MDPSLMQGSCLSYLVLCLSYAVNRGCWNSCPVTAGRYCFPLVIHDIWLLHSFHATLHDVIWTFSDGNDIDIPFVMGQDRVTHSLHFGQWDNHDHSIEKLLWWILSVALIYGYGCKNLKGSLTMCPFSKIMEFIDSMVPGSSPSMVSWPHWEHQAS